MANAIHGDAGWTPEHERIRQEALRVLCGEGPWDNKGYWCLTDPERFSRAHDGSERAHT